MSVGVINLSMASANDDVTERINENVETLAEAGVNATEVNVLGYRAATVATLAIAEDEFAAFDVFERKLPGSGTGYNEP